MSKTTLVALRNEREKTIQLLSDAFAADLLEVEEFELRLEKAQLAQSCEALVMLRRDIEGEQNTESALATQSSSYALVSEQPKKRSVISIFGGAERKGKWRVPKTLRVIALMGGSTLDFREALIPPGISEVKIVACMGGVDIIVPPDLEVECSGIAILGGFASQENYTGDSSEGPRPRLRISGTAVMGGVDITSRYPGESSRQARKRRKREAKAKYKQLKD